MEKPTEYKADNQEAYENHTIPITNIGVMGIHVEDEPKPALSHYPIIIKELLPFEIFDYQELIHAYYKEIEYKDAVEDVKPFMAIIAQNLKSDTYYRFCIAYQDNLAVGYIYYRVFMTARNKPALEIIQHYTRPEVRGNIRIYKDLVAHAMDFGRRCRVQKAIINVVNLKLRNFYVKAGFKTIQCTLEFDGTYEDFMNRNNLWR